MTTETFTQVDFDRAVDTLKRLRRAVGLPEEPAFATGQHPAASDILVERVQRLQKMFGEIESKDISDVNKQELAHHLEFLTHQNAGVANANERIALEMFLLGVRAAFDAVQSPEARDAAMKDFGATWTPTTDLDRREYHKECVAWAMAIRAAVRDAKKRLKASPKYSYDIQTDDSTKACAILSESFLSEYSDKDGNPAIGTFQLMGYNGVTLSIRLPTSKKVAKLKASKAKKFLKKYMKETSELPSDKQKKTSKKSVVQSVK